MILVYGLSVAWFTLALILAFALERQADRHAIERELWRAERQVLQARALKPMPSARRPAAADDDVEAPTSKEEKLAELKRLAGRNPLAPEEPRDRYIVPTDL